VISIDETKDSVLARVQGSRKTPYKVKIQIKPLTDGEWKKVFDALAEQAIFTAQLLAGEMPQDIEQAFDTAKVSLFPAKRGNLKTDCSCPDYANPCKHIAATHYILGGDVEIEDGAEEPESVIPLDEQIAQFWEFPASLDGFSISIHPPTIEMPLLKRLGEASFVPKPGIESLLKNAYQSISKKAIETAYQENEETA